MHVDFWVTPKGSTPVTADLGDTSSTQMFIHLSQDYAPAGTVSFLITNTSTTMEHELVGFATPTMAADYPITGFEGDPNKIDEDKAGTVVRRHRRLAEAGSLQDGHDRDLTAGPLRARVQPLRALQGRHARGLLGDPDRLAAGSRHELRMQTVPKHPTPIGPFRDIVTGAEMTRFERAAGRAADLLAGRTMWHVNSTSDGGGVAEMLHMLVCYYLGCGVDARWAVLTADQDFFGVTKRIHNRLHGDPGDGGPLGANERAIYDRGIEANGQLLDRVGAGDVVVLHDPQTFGFARPLSAAGAWVVCVCHVGSDLPNELTRSAWGFFSDDTDAARAIVFSRSAYVWSTIEPARARIIPPCIDPFSVKNAEIDPLTCRAILSATGLVPDRDEGRAYVDTFRGETVTIQRPVSLVEATAVPPDAPLVVQVSRWDRLKDPEGVMQGFAEGVPRSTGAHLVLAGPSSHGVSDDPEGSTMFTAVRERWEQLPSAQRARIHLAELPMADLDENAAIVNALQRSADVVVQKSLAEGFGLTVTEAMWKQRAVVASRVGGIQDQIVDGRSGVLVDPIDLPEFGRAVARTLKDEVREALGRRAKERVRSAYLPPHHMSAYLELIEEVVTSR